MRLDKSLLVHFAISHVDFLSVANALLHILALNGLAALTMLTFTLYAGVALGWTRMVTGSIWTAVLARNIANVASAFIDYIQAPT